MFLHLEFSFSTLLLQVTGYLIHTKIKQKHVAFKVAEMRPILTPVLPEQFLEPERCQGARDRDEAHSPRRRALEVLIEAAFGQLRHGVHC